MKKLLCKEQVEDKYDAKVFYEKGKTYDFENKRADELLNAYNGRYFEEAKVTEKEVVEDVKVEEEKPKKKRVKA